MTDQAGWLPAYAWCDIAIQNAGRFLGPPRPVSPDTVAAGTPDGAVALVLAVVTGHGPVAETAAKTVHRRLAADRSQLQDPARSWVGRSRACLIEVADEGPPADPGQGSFTLVAYDRRPGPLIGQLVGTEGCPPEAAGFVVVHRGHLVGNGAGIDVFLPGGASWPDGPDVPSSEPVVGAWSVDRAGQQTVLMSRVGSDGEPVGFPVVPGAALAYPGVLGAPGELLRLFTVRDLGPGPVRVPEPFVSEPFTPEHLVGRFWLHQVGMWLSGQADGPPDPDLIGALDELAGGGWSAVRADQAGSRVLGALLTDDEARSVPDGVLPWLCAASTDMDQAGFLAVFDRALEWARSDSGLPPDAAAELVRALGWADRIWQQQPHWHEVGAGR